MESPNPDTDAAPGHDPDLQPMKKCKTDDQLTNHQLGEDDVEVVKLVIQKEHFVSSHLSIFPSKEATGPLSQSAVNNHTIPLVNETDHFIVPGNFAYYMRQEQDPKYRWYPDAGLRNMLNGSSRIIFCEKVRSIDIPKPKCAGWIDYAHADGSVYSATYSGLFSTIKQIGTDFADTLVELRYHSNPAPASNCSTLSAAELKEMDCLTKRAEFIKQIASMHNDFSGEQISEWLQDNESEAREMFGAGNYVVDVTNDFKFPCVYTNHSLAWSIELGRREIDSHRLGLRRPHLVLCNSPMDDAVARLAVRLASLPHDQLAALCARACFTDAAEAHCDANRLLGETPAPSLDAVLCDANLLRCILSKAHLDHDASTAAVCTAWRALVTETRAARVHCGLKAVQQREAPCASSAHGFRDFFNNKLTRDQVRANSMSDYWLVLETIRGVMISLPFAERRVRDEIGRPWGRGGMAGHPADADATRWPPQGQFRWLWPEAAHDEVARLQMRPTGTGQFLTGGSDVPIHQLVSTAAIWRRSTNSYLVMVRPAAAAGGTDGDATPWTNMGHAMFAPSEATRFALELTLCELKATEVVEQYSAIELELGGDIAHMLRVYPWEGTYVLEFETQLDAFMLSAILGRSPDLLHWEKA